MAKDLQRLRRIYDKTDGYCHLCHRKLSFQNHGNRNTKGAWHIEHSIPKAQGGTDHLNNLLAACIDCNIEKSTLTSRTVRSHNGNTRAPYSKSKKKEIRDSNTAAGAIIGGVIGLVGGPWGAAIGATIGGMIGNSSSPRT
jgi:5-methylcytosine-specific restriction endonuclease McrA